MTATTRSSNGTDSIDNKEAMERFGSHYLEAKTCKSKVKRRASYFCFWLHHSLLCEVKYTYRYTVYFYYI